MIRKEACLCIIAMIIGPTLCYEKNQGASQHNFPDMFYMDDYNECSKDEGNSYCTANMNIIPKDKTSKLWKNIEDWSMEVHHYNRTILHRTFCIPKKYNNNLAKISFIENRTNEELKVYNLGAKIFSMDCMGEEYFGNVKATLTGLSMYLGLIFLATVYDQKYHIGTKQNIVAKWLIYFSLTSNYKKLTNGKNQDYQKLKCIQGIRTYQTLLVIMCHGCLVAAELYIKNTSFMEEMYLNPTLKLYLVFFMYIIQTYFVISSWLLTNQVLEIYKRNGRFSMKDGLIIYLHRIARFWAPLFAMTFLGVQLFVSFANGPGNFEMSNILCRSCRNYWWVIFIQATNFVEIKDVCNLGMWSLSIDTQFYIVGLAFLYIALNYQLDIKKCLAYMFIFTYIVNVVVFYKNDFPLLTWVHIKLGKRIDFYNEKTNPMSFTYFGFWVNAGSSLTGILFGYFYFLRKESTKIEPLEKLCGLVFATVPIAAVLSGTLDANRFVSSLIGPLLKPLFGFGIASGIYGMSRNIIQGWPKLVCENKYAVTLGNFTFSIYVCHFLVVFSRGAYSTTLAVLDVTELLLSSAMDILISFALGIVAALVIEQPGINIKKLILPQIRKKEEMSERQLNDYKYENKRN